MNQPQKHAHSATQKPTQRVTYSGAAQTRLQSPPHALWENPVEAAAFLQLDTEEATNEGTRGGPNYGHLGNNNNRRGKIKQYMNKINSVDIYKNNKATLLVGEVSIKECHLKKCHEEVSENRQLYHVEIYKFQEYFMMNTFSN